MSGLAIAGIPFEHETPSSIGAPRNPSPSWRGSRIVRDPIRIVHEVGDTSPHGLEPLIDAPLPLGTYYRDGAGQIAVRTQGPDGDYLPQLMRTIRPGYHYALRYETPADAPRMQWGWQRTIFMFALASRGQGVAAHACGFLLPDGRAVLAPGVSGSGKSTLARALAADVPEATVVGDDRIAVTVEPDGLRLWGTPWHSSARITAPDDGPLSAIVIVRHGGAPRVREVSASVAARSLLRTLSFPFWDQALMAETMRVADRIASEVPAYELSYAPTPGATRALVSHLMGA